MKMMLESHLRGSVAVVCVGEGTEGHGSRCVLGRRLKHILLGYTQAMPILRSGLWSVRSTIKPHLDKGSELGLET
jgi:hypothetical protein